MIEGEKIGVSIVIDFRLPLNEVLRSDIELRPSLIRSLIIVIDDLRSFLSVSCGGSFESLLVFLDTSWSSDLDSLRS